MGRTVQEQVVNTLNRGLITEATVLNFPENAVTETFNCKFDQTGLVTRRFGIDRESGFSTNSEVRTDDFLSLYEWDNVAGEGGLTFYVTQIGRYLIFYEEDTASALSTNKKTFEVDLNTYKSGTINPETAACSFANINGDLFVCNPHIDPVYVRYSVSGDSITTTLIPIKIRDLEGIDSEDITDNEERSTFMGSGAPGSHLYNLLNQGWYKDAAFDSSGNHAIVLSRWDSIFSDYPSLADIWWLMKDSNDSFDTAAGTDRTAFGNTRAPAGHYILDAFDQDRETPMTNDQGPSTVEDTVNYGAIANVTSGDKRPTTVVSFAGRVWYAGVEAQGFNSNIYFTQIITNENQYGLCYQKNDPTSEHLSDTLPTDGGTIKIPEIGKIISLRVLNNSLLIFAENGIWAISGGEGAAFKATDFSISKISEVRATATASFITVDNSIMWWAQDGIYIAQDDQTGGIVITSMIKDTIQTFYEEIPTISKAFAQGAYNREKGIVQWCYRSTSTTDTDEKHDYDRILNFNIRTQAFYPWSIEELASAPVFLNGVVSIHVGDNEVFLYLTSKLDIGSTYDWTWADETDTTYTDWLNVDATGVDYSSYFVAGQSILGNAMRFQQTNYLWVYMNTETNASLKVRARWDYSDSSSSNKWSTLQQAYSSRSNFEVSITRLKTRGEGRAVQVYGESETGKPFSLVGWAAFTTVNESP